MGPFTKAYYLYFLHIDIANGEQLDDAVKRSATFRKWVEGKLGDDVDLSQVDMDGLVDQFLSEVHLSSFDIKQIIDGEELMNKDNPELEDDDGPGAQEEIAGKNGGLQQYGY